MRLDRLVKVVWDGMLVWVLWFGGWEIGGGGGCWRRVVIVACCSLGMEEIYTYIYVPNWSVGLLQVYAD